MCGQPNPWKARKKKALTDAIAAGTLAGGTVGSQERSKSVLHSASSVAEPQHGAATLGMALDALWDMYAAVIVQDRKELDSAYETLITVVEDFRDAVPKA